MRGSKAYLTVPPSSKFFFIIISFSKILFLFRERGRKGEKEGEKHQCVVASQTFPTGELAHKQTGPIWADSRVGGFVYILGPCGFVQQTLL